MASNSLSFSSTDKLTASLSFSLSCAAIRDELAVAQPHQEPFAASSSTRACSTSACLLAKAKLNTSRMSSYFAVSSLSSAVSLPPFCSLFLSSLTYSRRVCVTSLMVSHFH